MKNFISLRILDKFSFIFKKSKVDYGDLRRIVQVKLTLDSRRENAFNKTKASKDEDINNGFFKTYFIYILFGLFMIPFAFIGESPFVGLNIFFGIIMFLLISSMISDFSSVILDTKDKLILLTRPITKESLTMARFIHIFIYLGTLMLVLTLPAIVAYTYKYGPLFGLILLMILVLICILSILCTSFIYTLLMRFFEGEKLKDIINIFQIFFILVLNVGYQVLIRMYNFMDINFDFSPKWWTYLIPPSWFAAPLEILVTWSFEIEYMILSIIAILVPLVSLIFYIRVIGPSFEGYLARLDSVEKAKIQKKNLRYRLRNLFDELISKNSIEKSFIKFTRIILKKERSVKFKVYPIISMGLLMPIVFVFIYSLDNGSLSLFSFMNSRENILFFYLANIMLTQIMPLTVFSDSYKGAWIYGLAPVEDPSSIIRASFKSVIVTYIVPVFLVFSVLGSYLFGFYSLIDFSIMFFSLIIAISLIIMVSPKRYPFSQKYTNEAQKENSLVNIFMSMIVTGFTFLMHKFFLYNFAYLLILLGAFILINFFFYRVAFKGEIE